MSEFQRYTDREIADAYTQFRMAIKGKPVNAEEFVRAADFDAQVDAGMALVADNERLRARIAALEAKIAKLENARDLGAIASRTIREESVAKNVRIAALEADLKEAEWLICGSSFRVHVDPHEWAERRIAWERKRAALAADAGEKS